MAPMRWQGGDRAPSRKSSLLRLLISNWPEPLTGMGILEWTTETEQQEDETVSAKPGREKKGQMDINCIFFEQLKLNLLPNYLQAISFEDPRI